MSLSTVYTPQCPQYSTGSGALVTLNANGFYAGNCSANDPGRLNPQLAPFDFFCSKDDSGKQMCVNTQTGFIGASPDSICCQAQPQPQPQQIYVIPQIIRPQPQPQPRPVPVPPHCLYSSINDCALRLDQQQGLSKNDSAGHFANINQCKRQCHQFSAPGSTGRFF